MDTCQGSIQRSNTSTPSLTAGEPDQHLAQQMAHMAMYHQPEVPYAAEVWDHAASVRPDLEARRGGKTYAANIFFKDTCRKNPHVAPQVAPHSFVFVFWTYAY